MATEETTPETQEETPTSPDPSPAKVEGDELVEGEPSESEEAAPRPTAPPSVPEGAAEPEPAAGANDVDRYLELAQRTQAEFDNYRKRAIREKAEAETRGAAKLAKELLPALDNLHIALAASGAEAGAFAEGVSLVQRDLLAALARAGIEPYSPEGEAFDPNAHEAMAQQPVEGAESGTIVQVYQRGFRHGETVLRPARVVVAA